MRKTVLALAVATGLSIATVGTLHAHDEDAPGAIDVSAIESGTYTADSGHSMVAWGIDHLGFNVYYGIFGDVSGTLSVDAENPAASSVDVTIPIASVTVPSEGLKDHLLRPGEDDAEADFFGPDPMAAHFVSTSVEPTGETTATITGDLTMNGVTKPVTIEAELSGMGANPMSGKKTLGFEGMATIMRSEFGIDYGVEFGLSDEVELRLTAAFEM